MPIINVTDNENSRWKKNAKITTEKTSEDRKKQDGTEARVKKSELNDFVVDLS